MPIKQFLVILFIICALTTNSQSSYRFGSIPSVNINTELGVIIKSPEMGARVGELADLQLRDRAYEVVLDEKGNLRWIDQSGEEPVYFTKEPDTTWWRRTKAQMGRILPIRSQL